MTVALGFVVGLFGGGSWFAGDGACRVIDGKEPFVGIGGRWGDFALVVVSSREDTLSGCRMGCCADGGVIEDDRGGWRGTWGGSGGGGVSTIWGTGFRSKEVVVAGGDLDKDGSFRISGMLAVLVRFVSSWLKMESNVGTEEFTLAEEDVAGREKFVAEAFAKIAALAGSFGVCAKFETSMDKFGSGGIAGTLVSGDSGLLPEGLPAAVLLAAR